MLLTDKPQKSGAGYFVAGILVLLILFGAAYFLKAPDIDEYGCQVEGPLGKTVVILDTSDPLNNNQRAALDSFLKSLVTPPQGSQTPVREWSPYVEQNELLVAYEIGDLSDAPTQQFKMCNPGHPADRSWIDNLTQGETLARFQWLDFDQKLKKAFPESITGKELPTSPIIETLDYVNKREFGNRTHLMGSNKSVGTIVIISDMLQNTPSCSHYRSCRTVSEKTDDKQAPKEGGKSGYFKCEQSNTCGSPKNAYGLYAGVDLTGLNIVIKYLQVDRYRKLQGDEHIVWWRKFFSIAGAPLSIPPESW